MADFSETQVEELLEAIRPIPPLIGPEGSRITVNDTISRFAFLYERLRNVVDYKDEHLIRKAAIGRILKRQLLLESDPHIIADRLLRELISARYLPNRILPDHLIQDVAVSLHWFFVLTRRPGVKDDLKVWLRSLLVVEIEEKLFNPQRETLLVHFLYKRLGDVLTLPQDMMTSADCRLQIYIACYRSFTKADDETLSAKLLRASIPEWGTVNLWVDQPDSMLQRLTSAKQNIEERLTHPLGQRFLRAVKPWSVSLRVLLDVLLEEEDKAAEVMKNPSELLKKVEVKTAEGYKKAKARLRRGTGRAIIYLFLTKMLVALLLELPIEQWWYHHVQWYPLGINLVFPPFLMLIVGLLIRVPGADNSARIARGVDELLSTTPMTPRDVRIPKKRHGLSQFFFALSYALTFLLSFGLVMLVLARLDFSWIAAPIFVFFLCVVSFFAFRLRLHARENVIVEGRDRLTGIMLDFFSLPILRAGQWLSRTISRMNIFLFFFDFIFEAPFKLFLAVLEEWFAFMKEKKEELQ